MRQHSPLQILMSVAALCILGLGIWWMSANVVWLGDDIDYKYRMKGEIWQSWGRIKTWSEFWKSQWVHYHHVNGRFVAHSLVQLFNGRLGQNVFAICNAIVYVLFAISIAKTSGVKISRNAGGVFTCVCLSVICFVTKMMPTCQIGYIWGMAANILWLSVFFLKGRKSWWAVALMFLAGIIVGNWQESISIGVCAGLGTWWLSQFFRRDKTFHSFFDWRRSWTMLGYFLGTAGNCLAPSTLSRVSTVTTPLSDQLLVASYSILGVILFILTIIYLGIRGKSKLTLRFDNEKGGIPDGFFIIALMFLLIFNIIIGVYSNRQLFGANLFAVILLLRALPVHRFNVFFNIVAGMAVLAIWAVNYVGIEAVRRQYEDIKAIHAESKDGTVEYDRVRVMTLGHPSDAKYFEDILGQFDNDLHHSLMKDFWHTRKGKTLKLKPTATPDSVGIKEYAPGHFYVTVEESKKGAEPQEITIHGHYTILGLINIPAEDRKMQILKYSRRKGGKATAVVIPEYPLFKTDSITPPQPFPQGRE